MLQSAVEKRFVRIFVHPGYINEGRDPGLVLVDCFERNPAVHESRTVMDVRCKDAIRFEFHNFHRPFDRGPAAFIAPVDDRPNCPSLSRYLDTRMNGLVISLPLKLKGVPSAHRTK